MIFFGNAIAHLHVALESFDARIDGHVCEPEQLIHTVEGSDDGGREALDLPLKVFSVDGGQRAVAACVPCVFDAHNHDLRYEPNKGRASRQLEYDWTEEGSSRGPSAVSWTCATSVTRRPVS
jgi:hypothetical protein